VADLLSGAVITESVFGIPGIGRVSVNAIQNRDFPLLMGSVLLTVILVVFGNLAADISYAYLDPRIKYE
jgi:peptide/nickel transport system permease protein